MKLAVGERGMMTNELKRWSPASRNGSGDPHMVRDAEGCWVWAAHAEERDKAQAEAMRDLTEKLAALEAENATLKATIERLSPPVQALVDGMETCHECKRTILVEEQPVHCENCSYDCDSHEGAECPTIYSLHLAVKNTLIAARAAAPEGGERGKP